MQSPKFASNARIQCYAVDRMQTQRAWSGIALLDYGMTDRSTYVVSFRHEDGDEWAELTNVAPFPTEAQAWAEYADRLGDLYPRFDPRRDDVDTAAGR